jgi:hypothetical protein
VPRRRAVGEHVPGADGQPGGPQLAREASEQAYEWRAVATVSTGAQYLARTAQARTTLARTTLARTTLARTTLARTTLARTTLARTAAFAPDLAAAASTAAVLRHPR